MAIQPTRPDGSAQVLRYRGALVLGANAFGVSVPPIANAVVPNNVVASVAMGVRFLFADATDPAAQVTRFPLHDFDDSQPAGAAPHAPVTLVVPNVTTANDLVVTQRTWAQNMYITVQPADAAAAVFLTGVDRVNAQVVLDVGLSGMGSDTGLNVLILPLVFSVGAGAFPVLGVNVDILVEIRHTVVR